MSEEITCDEVTYGETRTINIGDYESRNMFLSFKTKIKKISKKNNGISIHAHAKSSLEEFEGDFNKTAKHTIGLVRGILDKQESIIRKAYEDYSGQFISEKKDVLEEINSGQGSKKRKKIISKLGKK